MPREIVFPVRDQIPPFYGMTEAQMIQRHKISIYRGVTSAFFLDHMGESQHFIAKTIPASRTSAPYAADATTLLHVYTAIIGPTDEIIKEYENKYELDTIRKHGLLYLVPNQLTTIDDLYEPRVLVYNECSKDFKLFYMDRVRDKRCKSDSLLGIVGIKKRSLDEFKEQIRTTMRHCHLNAERETFDRLEDDSAIGNIIMAPYINNQIMAEAKACHLAYTHSADVFGLRIEYKDSSDPVFREYNPLYPPLAVGPDMKFDPISAYAAYLLARCEEENFKTNMDEQISYEEDFEL